MSLSLGLRLEEYLNIGRGLFRIVVNLISSLLLLLLEVLIKLSKVIKQVYSS